MSTSSSARDMGKLFEWQGARGLMPSFRQNLRSSHVTKMGHKKRKKQKRKRTLDGVCWADEVRIYIDPNSGLGWLDFNEWHHPDGIYQRHFFRNNSPSLRTHKSTRLYLFAWWVRASISILCRVVLFIYLFIFIFFKILYEFKEIVNCQIM